MSNRRDRRINAIAEGMNCPQCDYSLRGLNGQIVDCPECGVKCDRVELAKAAWRHSHFATPGLVALLLPIIWLLVGVGIVMALYPAGPSVTGTVAAVWAVIWVVILVQTARQFRFGEGTMLLLLAHGLAIACVAMALGIWVTMAAIVSVVTGPTFAKVLAVMVLIGWLYVLDRGIGYVHRAITTRCFRSYLQKHSLL